MKETGGYSVGGNVEGLIDSLRGRPALVCGGAEGVFDEINAVLPKLKDPVIFAANEVGMSLEPLDHWVTLHVNNLREWRAVRWLHGVGSDLKYHSISESPWIDYHWNIVPLFALSGYFAMQIAHLMGAGQIILCGCPGNANRRFFERLPKPDFGYGAGSGHSDKGIREQIVNEMARLPEFKNKVRSMSGWTREFFGSL